jgi:hypothetical protein
MNHASCMSIYRWPEILLKPRLLYVKLTITQEAVFVILHAA